MIDSTVRKIANTGRSRLAGTVAAVSALYEAVCLNQTLQLDQLAHYSLR